MEHVASAPSNATHPKLEGFNNTPIRVDDGGCTSFIKLHAITFNIIQQLF